MPNATITANDIISRYANDIAYIAEKAPATDLDGFIDQRRSPGLSHSPGLRSC